MENLCESESTCYISWWSNFAGISYYGICYDNDDLDYNL